MPIPSPSTTVRHSTQLCWLSKNTKTYMKTKKHHTPTNAKHKLTGRLDPKDTVMARHTAFERNHIRRLMTNFAEVPKERIKTETHFCRKCHFFQPAHPDVNPDAGVCLRFAINAKPTGYAKYDEKIGTCFTPKKKD